MNISSALLLFSHDVSEKYQQEETFLLETCLKYY